MNDKPVFGSFGRFQETPKAEMPPDMKAAFDFTMKLRGEVPGPHKIYYGNSGAEAIEAALKLARAFTGRDVVAVCGDQPFFAF